MDSFDCVLLRIINAIEKYSLNILNCFISFVLKICFKHLEKLVFIQLPLYIIIFELHNYINVKFMKKQKDIFTLFK